MIDPTHIFLEAKSLASKDVKLEARHRTIIGRAYYGTYHAITLNKNLSEIVREYRENYLAKRKKDHTLPHISGHSLMIEALASNSDTSTRYIGRQLFTLFERRIKADYKIDESIIPTMSADCIDIAEEIFADYLGIQI